MTKYSDLREIGSGGFSEVYACRSNADGKTYAKKILASSADEDSIKRFMKEIRILSALDHPNIIKVVGKRLRSPPFFYVIPLYKRSLRAELPRLVGNESRIDTIFNQILKAIEYAHSEGIIHRDLKPENVLLNDDNDLVVTDFGMGRIIDSDSTRQTTTGVFMGTQWYIAPEQTLDAKRADERSDIFSLGRMLYEMYTGPLTSSVQNTLTLPPSIAMIVERCTQQYPDKRFQTVSDLRMVWQNLHDKTNLKTRIEELIRLRTPLAVDDRPSIKDVKRFCKLIVKYLNDGDLVHETIMQMSPQAAAEIYAEDSDLMRRIISAYVKFVCAQGWPFGYTDKIAKKCRDLYHNLEDPRIRADLLYCITKVGLSHNRFYVIDIMRNLFHAKKDTDEWSAIERRFLEEDKMLCYNAGKYLQLSKLPPTLISLFDSEKD